MIAVPNFSEGRDAAAIEAITAAFAPANLLDRHTDPVHNRTVLTLEARGAELPAALAAGARAAIERIDIGAHEGEHPCIGALDVAPILWIGDDEHSAARDLALETALAIADVGVPVFLYGELASDPIRGERAFFRRGGIATLTERMHSGELAPDLGPAMPHPRGGATLVTARRPLAAFNVELDTADAEVARQVAFGLRESGGGIPSVRAIGVDLGGVAQVSTNIHDPIAVPLGRVIERIRELAAQSGARPVAGEVVGLLPEAALRDLPEDVPLRGFDPERDVLERRIST
jgi:glutamate formiminotransferase / 5-formyltetrahydrofolate cyclo-ligase